MKLKNKRIPVSLFSVFCFVFVLNLPAQTSSELYHELLKLRETKRVLYLAAHPDDENTRLIAYLANASYAQVAYLSLTRGDGGQNLIGKELGIQLGMIRTQELIRARETDGGRQYFSRAIDFGFSKHPDETLTNWDREKLLSDVVWIIRKFQPDIMINRFNDEPGTTHGHHTTSAILSLEAFDKAGDPNVFPDQLQWVQPWSPRRVFWNAYSWGGQYEPKEGKRYHRFNVGEVNPVLGTSYSKIAADSRTMHKSQGFGSSAQVGESDDFMELVKGQSFSNDPFEDIPNRWESVPGGKGVEIAINGLVNTFDFRSPANNLGKLLDIREKLLSIKTMEVWLDEKKEALDQLVLASLGLTAEFLSNKEVSFPSDEITTRLIINNPTGKIVNVQSFEVLGKSVDLQAPLKDNKQLEESISLKLPNDFPISQPYWLVDRPDENLFSIGNQLEIGKPFNDPTLSGKLSFLIEGNPFELEIPLIYKYNDQVDGEIRQPFAVVPEVSLSINKDNVFLLNGISDDIKVEVSFQKEILEGELGFDGLTDGEFEIRERTVDEERKRVTYTVTLNAHQGPEKSAIGVKYTTHDGKEFDKGKGRINYKHIPNLTFFPPAEINLIRLQLGITSQRIGYVPGAGDDVPGVLSNLGYSVEILDPSSLRLDKLMAYQTVIVGIRAFNVNQALADEVDQLMAYVEAGGNLIVQYNTSSPLLTRKLGPYPFALSRDRVAVEDSPVKADFKAHPIMHYPNVISMGDFEGWVQERGLYFPGTWDSRYVTPLEMQDPGEASSSKGALLLADYGKGTYAYSGISWFRLLPAGVPGAIKLFVNLIERANEK